MPFSQFGDEWRRLPEARAAGALGRDFFVCALQWCNEHRTDGLIPAEVVREIAPRQRYPMKSVDALLAVGWLEQIGGGYRIPPSVYRRHNLFRQDLENRRGSPRRSVDKPVDSRPPSPALDARSTAPGRLDAGSRSARCDAKSGAARTSGTSAHARDPVPLDPVVETTGQRLGDARESEAVAVDNVAALLDMAAAWSASGQQEKADELMARAIALDETTRKPPAAAESRTEAASSVQDARTRALPKEATA
jgi:hypothetical protein